MLAQFAVEPVGGDEIDRRRQLQRLVLNHGFDHGLHGEEAGRLEILAENLAEPP